jgi:hypothetical protein
MCYSQNHYLALPFSTWFEEKKDNKGNIIEHWMMGYTNILEYAC